MSLTFFSLLLLLFFTQKLFECALLQTGSTIQYAESYITLLYTLIHNKCVKRKVVVKSFRAYGVRISAQLQIILALAQMKRNMYLLFTHLSCLLSRSRSQRQQDKLISHPLPQQLPQAPLDLKLSGLFWTALSLLDVLGRSPRLFTVSRAWNTFKGRCPGVQPPLSI